MADEVDVQTEEPRSITISRPVIGQFTDVNLVKVSSIKRLGVYGKNELLLLRDLFSELLTIINTRNSSKYELYDNKKLLQVRLEKEDEVSLTSDDGFPNEATGDKRTLLFFTDVVAILIDIAKLLQFHHETNYLRYIEKPDTEKILEDWGQAEDGYLSQLSLQYAVDDLNGLFINLTYVFTEIEKLGEKEKEPADKEKKDDADAGRDDSDDEDSWPSTANVAEPAAETPGAETADAATSPDSEPTVNREDTEVQHQIQTETNWVFNAARVNLLQQYLDAAGIDINSLPSDLRYQLTQLEDSLQGELRRIAAGLSDTELQQLLDHRFRYQLYRRLLQELLADPSSLFYSQLLNFYKDYAEAAVAATPAPEKPAVVARLESVLAVATVEGEAITESSEVHAAVQAWLTELKTQFATELNTPPEEAPIDEADTAVLDEILTEAPVPLVSAGVPVNFSFSPTQQAELQTGLDRVVSLPAAERQALQNQSARLVWGTVAELFGESSDVPPQLVDQISGTAISYLLSKMDANDLQRLAKSPSSLLRHIRTLSLELQKQPQFQLQYQQFMATRSAPAVSRTEILEKEVAASANAVIEGIFYEKGVTEASLNRDPELKEDFAAIKELITQEIYVELSQLTIEQLQLIASDPTQQAKLFTSLELELLKNNPQLAQFVRAFLRRYVSYLIANGRGDEAKKIQSSLIEVRSALDLDTPPAAVREELAQSEAQARVEAQAGSRRVADTHASTPAESGTGPELIQTTSEAVRKKKDILHDLLQSEWDQLKPEEKIAVYLHYDYPVPKPLLQPNPNLDQVEEYFVLVPEFLDLDKKKLLPILVYNLSHPPTGKPELSLDEPLKADSLKKIDAEAQISDRALTQQLSYTAEKLNPETQALLVKYYETGLADRESVLEAVLAEREKFFEELAQAYNLEAAEVEQMIQLANEEAFRLELDAEIALAASQQLDQADGLDQSLAEPQAPQSFGGRMRSLLGGGAAAGAAGGQQTARQALQEKLFSRFSPSAGNLAKAGAVKAGLGALTGGTAAVAMSAAELLQNEKLRQQFIQKFITYAQYITAAMLMAFTNVAGLAAFLAVTGAVALTPFALAAIPAGLLAGMLASSLFLNAPGLLGIRMPPAPWDELSNSGPGMAQARAAQAAESQAAQGATSAQSAEASRSAASRAAAQEAAESSGSGGTGDGTGASTTATVTSSSVGASTAAATSSSGWLFALPLWVATPIGAFIFVMIISWSVFLVIMGAFMAPVPTRLSDYKGRSEDTAPTRSLYVDATKVATPAKIENLAAGAVSSITYTITLQPKAGYSIEIKSLKDSFSGFGEVVPPTIAEVSSPLQLSDFPSGRISDPVTVEYTVPIQGAITDALISNTALFSLTIYDAYDFPVKQNEIATAIGNLQVGTPKIGCWPTDGTIKQLPYGSFSHSKADAFDISNPTGTRIFAPFPGEVCDKGRDTTGFKGGYGRYATLQFSIGAGSSQKLVLVFGHLQSGPADLFGGELNGARCKQVAAGQLIATMDSTGNSTGSHLHYELWSNPYSVELTDIIQGGADVKVSNTVKHCFAR